MRRLYAVTLRFDLSILPVYMVHCSFLWCDKIFITYKKKKKKNAAIVLSKEWGKVSMFQN